jgi:two-component system response regulator PilR (NtrC family)
MTEATNDSTERLRGRLKWFLFFRVALVSCLLGALALLYLSSGEDRYAVSINLLLFAIVVTYGLTIVSAVSLIRLGQLAAFTYGQLAFDVVLVTGVVFVTGGADSPFGFLYSLPVISGAVLLSTPGAVVMASTSSIAYAALVALLGSGLVARPDYPFPPAPPDLQFAMRFATTNATFFVIAFLAGSLVRRLHEAERLLEQREAERDRLTLLHEALARNIGSALVSTDCEGTITSANQPAADLAGMSTVDLVGKDVGAVFAPLRHTPAGRQQFLQSSTVQPIELVHRMADESERVLRCAAVPLRDTYSNPIGGLYILQDITVLRRLEQRLQGAEAEEAPVEDASEDVPAADGLIGASPAVRKLRDLIDKVARTDTTLLITGESGTGKELVARAVHARSARGDRAFVAVNCGAIPADLIESELFGHVKGAFTGAIGKRAGLFRAADGGTIFLDEIGELPLPLQVKLLRVLQERSFVPVGSDTPVAVDIRVIAATNRDLEEDVAAERFRHDLFYRLNVIAIELPPLRQRREDIPVLTRRFLRQFADLHGKRIQRLSVAAARRMQDYDYPGNVRELENIIEHAVAMCDGETVHEPHLPEYMLARRPTDEATSAPKMVVHPSAATPPTQAEIAAGNLDDNLAAYEKTIILRALAEAGGVKKRAAGLLGINYRSFRHRLQKYGIGESPHLPGSSQSAA